MGWSGAGSKGQSGMELGRKHEIEVSRGLGWQEGEKGVSVEQEF